MTLDRDTVLLFFAIAITIVVTWREARERKQLRPEAQRLVAALEAFKAANGRYPRWADELVPHHLDALPDPLVRRRIRYLVTEDGNECTVQCRHWLVFDSYFSRSHRWLEGGSAD